MTHDVPASTSLAHDTFKSGLILTARGGRGGRLGAVPLITAAPAIGAWLTSRVARASPRPYNVRYGVTRGLIAAGCTGVVAILRAISAQLGYASAHLALSAS